MRVYSFHNGFDVLIDASLCLYWLSVFIHRSSIHGCKFKHLTNKPDYIKINTFDALYGCQIFNKFWCYDFSEGKHATKELRLSILFVTSSAKRDLIAVETVSS